MLLLRHAVLAIRLLAICSVFGSTQAGPTFGKVHHLLSIVVREHGWAAHAAVSWAPFIATRVKLATYIILAA